MNYSSRVRFFNTSLTIYLFTYLLIYIFTGKLYFVLNGGNSNGCVKPVADLGRQELRKSLAGRLAFGVQHFQCTSSKVHTSFNKS